MRWRINSFFRRLKLRFFPLKPLHTVEEHKALLAKSRLLEDQIEKATKLLKCKPDEMVAKINKIKDHIAEMEIEIAKYNTKPPESV